MSSVAARSFGCVSSKRRRPRKRPAFTSITALSRAFLSWRDVVPLAILPEVLTGLTRLTLTAEEGTAEEEATAGRGTRFRRLSASSSF